MSKRNIVKGSAGYFITNIFNRGLGFLFIVLATRLIGAGGFGLIALGLTIRSLVNNFGIFGLSYSSQKILSGNFDEDKKNYFGAMVVINLSIALIFFLIFIIGSEFIANVIFNKPKFEIVVKVIAFTIVFSLPALLIRALLKAQKEVKSNFIVLVVESAVRVIALLLVFLIEDKIYAVSLSLFISAFASFLIALFIIKKRKLYPAFDEVKSKLKYIMSIGAQFLVIGLGYYFASQTDKLMLGRMVSSESLGIYSISISIAMIIGTLNSSMISIFMPTVSELHRNNNKREIKNTYNFANIIIATINIILFIFFIVYGKKMLDLLFNFDSLKVYYIFILLSLKFIIATFIGPTSALLIMTDNHKTELYNTIFMIILNILLNYFLISYYGVYGAVFATLISTILFNILQLSEIYYYYKFFVFQKIHLYYFISISVISILLINYRIMNLNIIFQSIYFILFTSIILFIFWQKNEVVSKNEIIHFVKNIKSYI